MDEKLYGGRNPMQQDRMYDGIFSKHMLHMTSENLFEKGAIAMELAYRDIRIMELEAVLKKISEGKGTMRDYSTATMDGKPHYAMRVLERRHMQELALEALGGNQNES